MFLGFPATLQSASHGTGRASFFICGGWHFWRVFDWTPSRGHFCFLWNDLDLLNWWPQIILLRKCPLVHKYQLYLTCRLSENRYALLKSNCWPAKYDLLGCRRVELRAKRTSEVTYFVLNEREFKMNLVDVIRLSNGPISDLISWLQA